MVSLPYAQWVYLLGWMEAYRKPDESAWLTDAIVTIAGQVRDA